MAGQGTVGLEILEQCPDVHRRTTMQPGKFDLAVADRRQRGEGSREILLEGVADGVELDAERWRSEEWIGGNGQSHGGPE